MPPRKFWPIAVTTPRWVPVRCAVRSRTCSKTNCPRSCSTAKSQHTLTSWSPRRARARTPCWNSKSSRRANASKPHQNERPSKPVATGKRKRCQKRPEVSDETSGLFVVERVLERAEEFPDLVGKRCRLLPRPEMPTPWHLLPVGDIEESFSKCSRRRNDILGKNA